LTFDTPGVEEIFLNLLTIAERNRMDTLIIYAHPNPKSFCHAIQQVVVDTVTACGGTAVVRDLYAQGFDPVLKPADFEALGRGEALADVKAEQEAIRKAGLIVVVYPLWWTGLPAILKGYIDRVFSHGFAYEIGKGGIKGLLGGKKVLLITTQGAPTIFYVLSGMMLALRGTVDRGIFGFCAMSVKEHLFFGEVPSVSDAVRKRYLAAAACAVKRALTP
jgi:NAD(P)H dehydrogenase (quinone)